MQADHELVTQFPLRPDNPLKNAGPPVRTEECACGGLIGAVASRGAQMQGVYDAVQNHQLTKPHNGWDSAKWVESHSSQQDVYVVSEHTLVPGA